MIGQLLIREKGIRSMVWLPIGLAAGLVLAVLARKPPGGLPFLPEAFRAQYYYYPALYHWAYLAGFAAYAGVTGRSGRLYMALPITAFSLWLSRILAMVMGGIAIIAIEYGVLAVVGMIQGQNLINESLRSLALGLTSCYLLGILLAQLPEVSLSEVPTRPVYIVYLCAVWLVTLILATFVSAYPYLILLPLALACLVFVRIYRALPECFTLAGREPAAVGSHRSSDPTPAGIDGGTLREATLQDPATNDAHPLLVVLRILYSPWLAPLLFIWLAFVGLRNAGYGFGGLSNTAMVVWAILALSGFIAYALPRLYMIDALPVSRKTVFAFLVIPGLIVALGSYTVGTVRAKGLFTGRHIVTYESKYYDEQYDVRVPLEFWEMSADGNPAPVAGCCDEPHSAWSTELLKGTDLILYSPYHAPPGSPPDFVAAQLSRAIEDVFGERIPPSELQHRYFDTGPDGGTILKTEPVDIMRDYPVLQARGWSGALPLVYLLVGLPWFLYLSLAMGPLRSRVPGKSLLRGHLIVTFVAMGFLILMIWASSNGITKEYKVSAALGIMLRKAAEAVPGGAVSLWVISLLMLAAAYPAAQSGFLKYEFPAKPGG